MKRVLFAFLFVGAFAFSTSANIDVLKTNIKTCFKKDNLILGKKGEIKRYKMNFVEFCSYTSYTNGN